VCRGSPDGAFKARHVSQHGASMDLKWAQQAVGQLRDL
jgi:hypothetical protein